MEIANQSPPTPWKGLRLIGVVFVVSVLIRLCYFDFESPDYVSFLSRWYDYIQTHGHFMALKYNFSDYPLLYLYILTVLTLVPLNKLFAIKIVSIIFDYVAAYFVFKIVALKYGRGWVAAAAAAAVMLLPTVVLNSSVWGQCDIIYTCALLGCLYWILEERPAAAMLAFGFAVSFKPQALFFGPFLLGLLLIGRISWRHFLIPLAVWLLAAVPAWLIGKPLAMIFYNQIGKALGILAGHPADIGSAPKLTFGAPNFYALFPPNFHDVFQHFGLLFATLAALLLSFSMYVWRADFLIKIGSTGISGGTKNQPLQNKWGPSPENLVGAALLSLLLGPFFLPGIHERYFFAADLFGVVYGFLFPRIWIVTVCIGGVSLFSYFPYLFGLNLFPLFQLSVVMGLTIALLVIRYLFRLHTSTPKVMEKEPSL